MATYYIDSAAGGSGAGTSFANAYPSTLQAIAGITLAAGDEIRYASSSDETVALNTSVTWALPNTPDNPVRIVSVNKSTGVPTPGAKITLTGVGTFNMSGAYYASGLVVLTANNTALLQANTIQLAIIDNFKVSGTGIEASSFFVLGSGSTIRGSKALFRNLVLSHDQYYGKIVAVRSRLDIEGLSFSAGSATCTVGLFQFSGFTNGTGDFRITRGDFTNLTSSLVLFNAENSGESRAMLRSCRFPAGWDYKTKTYTGAFTETSVRAELYDFFVGTTRVQLYVQDAMGYAEVVRTVSRTGGANDGAAMSMKIVTTALTNEFATHETIELPPVYNSIVGASRTVTVEILGDTATALTNAEARLDIFTPDGTYSSGRVYPTAATNLTTSDEAWTTPGVTNPQARKLSVTFTPATEGFIQARVKIGRPSTTVYVDPKITVA